MYIILIEQRTMQFHYMTDMATPWHKNLYPGGQAIINFGRPYLCHNYTLRFV